MCIIYFYIGTNTSILKRINFSAKSKGTKINGNERYHYYYA